MKYEELVSYHLKYGTTEEDIRVRKGYTEILENVVIAPWWSHDIFNDMGFKIVQTSEKVYNFYSEELSFSYIELKSIGAPAIMDFVLSLGVTKCKNMVFLGSAGSLDKDIKIGDIVKIQIKEISNKVGYDRNTIARILSASNEYSVKESNRRAHLGTGKTLSKAVLQLDKKTEQIIAEYYYPEFAEQSVSDVIASINRTRGVVHIWK